MFKSIFSGISFSNSSRTKFACLFWSMDPREGLYMRHKTDKPLSQTSLLDPNDATVAASLYPFENASR